MEAVYNFSLKKEQVCSRSKRKKKRIAEGRNYYNDEIVRAVNC